MPNGNRPDKSERPEPVEEFKPETPGPALHVYGDRGAADRASESLPGETRVNSRKVDGRQRHVVETRSGSGWGDGVEIESWVEVPYDPAKVS